MSRNGRVFQSHQLRARDKIGPEEELHGIYPGIIQLYGWGEKKSEAATESPSDCKISSLKQLIYWESKLG